jgi:septal ring-binding cell division protein DamX
VAQIRSPVSALCVRWASGMEKSQLRRLAIDFAQGEVDHDSYVRERTELIDAIVSGQMVIERELPIAPKRPKPKEPPPPDMADTMELAAVAAPARLKPAHIVVGGIIIAVIAGVLLSGGEEPPPPPPVIVQPDPPTASSEPAAKLLIDKFLAANYWGEDGLNSFARKWDELTDAQREDARSAPWFRPLTTALKQEINAQRALAGLDGGESTRSKGRRLVDFAKTLGVAGPFPSFASAAAKTPLAAGQPPVDEPASTETTAAQSIPAQADEPPTSPVSSIPATNSVTQVASAPTPQSATSPSVTTASPSDATSRRDATRPWLNSLPDDTYALQLFAVRKLDEVDKLIKANAGHGLHVIPASSPSGPLYRVVTGPFSDELSAKAAFTSLPAELKRDQTTPLVRKVSALQNNAVVAPLATAGVGTAPQGTDSQSGALLASGGPDGYTLQLLMSQTRANVQRVVEAYPEFALRIHSDGKALETFRVLYGDFPTADAAKNAASALPESLLSTLAGPPLVKASDEPEGAVVTVATRE